jgi:hypothetical protein
MDNIEKLREKLCVIFALFLIALVTVPASGAEPNEAVRVFSGNDTAGYLPVDVLSIDPSIKDATTDYTFLIMSPEGKETRLNDVNLSIDLLYPGDPTAPRPAAIPFTLVIIAMGITGAIAICQRSKVNPAEKTGGYDHHEKP